MRKRLVIGMLTTALLAAGCGSSGGGGANSEDAFLDQVDAICRTAGKTISALDGSDNGVIDDYGDALSTASEDLSKLKAPSKLSDDFDTLTATFDDESSQATKLAKAVDDEDADAISTASEKLTKLQGDADDAADSLDAQRCKNLALPDGAVTVPTDPTTPPTEATVPPTVATTPPTEATVPPTAATTPPTDATIPPSTDSTLPGGIIYPSDLNTSATAPPGFTWVDYEQSDAAVLYAKTDIGPIITFYGAGRIKNTADGYTASIFVLRTTVDIVQPALDQYLYWEGTQGGTDVTTPEGVAAKQQLLAFDQTDCVTAYGGNAGVTVCTFAGIDGLPVLDAFLDAQEG